MTNHRLMPAAAIGAVTAMLLAVTSSTTQSPTDPPAPTRAAFDWTQATGPVHPFEDNPAAGSADQGGVVVQDVSTGAFTTVPVTGKDDPTRTRHSR